MASNPVALGIAVCLGFTALSTYSPPLVWKKKGAVETQDWVPVSVAYSPDGKSLVVGGADGRVVSFDSVTRMQKWRTDGKGDFAAVAFAADGKAILATFEDGVRYLDAENGTVRNFLIENGSRPIALGVFPDREFIEGRQRFLAHKVIFGNARNYLAKIWMAGGAASTTGISAVAKDDKPPDRFAVPLAVDPRGLSVIVNGPIDSETGKNVLWAWTAGNYESRGQGNRILKGHDAPVVSAAWSTDGKIAATGDASGRVILWDALEMKETSRVELGERVAALALTPDGKFTAAVSIGKRAEFYAWETERPAGRKMIHIDYEDFSGAAQACLAFSPDGRQLAGCANKMDTLGKAVKLAGTLSIWEAEKP